MSIPIKRIFYGYAAKTNNGWKCFYTPQDDSYYYFAVVINVYEENQFDIELLQNEKELSSSDIGQEPLLKPGQALKKVHGSLRPEFERKTRLQARNTRLKNLHDLFVTQPVFRVKIYDDILEITSQMLLQAIFTDCPTKSTSKKCDNNLDNQLIIEKTTQK